MERLADIVARHVSKKRFRHIQGVVETAKGLAFQHGADPDRAEAAAWLHDVYREKTESELAGLAQDAGMSLPDGDPETWHGPVTAARLERDFGVAGPDIAHAVACHTTGCVDMPLLTRVLYVADAVEPGRDYPGIEALRALAAEDLTQAVRRVAEESIRFLLDEGKTIALVTVEMRNRLLGIAARDSAVK